MKIITTLEEWRQTQHPSLGFVPTMGNLHEGHISLMTQSQRDNAATAVSIFVNPTQFNQPNDFTHYPRTVEADLALLDKKNIDYCFLPTESLMYSDAYRFRLEETTNNETMEGKRRPGHFTGVLTVVMKLFNWVQPTRAYFGEKDFQQLQLIRDMVSAFFLDIEVIGCPIIRESSQLPMSSRNTRLSVSQRQLADRFAAIFHQHHHTCEQITEALTHEGIVVDYIEEHHSRRFAAVNIDNIRLIDNYELFS